MASPSEKPYKFIPAEKKQLLPAALLAGGLLLILLLLAGAAWYLLKDRSTAPPPPLPSFNISTSVSNATEECSDDACIATQARQTQNPTLCGLIQDNAIRQGCYESLAGADLSACEQVQDYELRKECAFVHARLENSIRSCQRLGLTDGDKRACILTIDRCYLEEGSAQKLCRALTNTNVSFCGQEEDCVLRYAMARADETSCTEIEGLAQQYACVSSVKGYSVCGELSDPRKKDYCYELYAKRSNQSWLCDQISIDGVDYQWRCYAYFAVATNSTRVCDSVDLLERWECYANFSLETRTTAGCGGIHDLALIAKTNCYFDLAEQENNPAVCEEFGYSNDKERCLSAIIREHTAPIALENCAPIQPRIWRNACYTEVAKDSNSTAICTLYIEREGEQQSCIRRVEGTSTVTSTNSST